MDENEDTISPARRTRSRKGAKTPVVKSPKAKPATRRTRKKVVLMEVEVSDEDEETIQDVDISEEEKQQKTHEESTEDTEKDKEAESNKECLEDKLGVNGSENNAEVVVPDSTEDSVTLVFNDVEMLEGADDSNSREQDDEDDESNTNLSQIDKESDDKMEVELQLVETVEIKEPPSGKALKVKSTEENETKLGIVEAEKTENSAKEKTTKVTKKTAGMKKETTETPVKLAKSVNQDTKIEVEVSEETNSDKTEKETKTEGLAPEHISKDTEKVVIEDEKKFVTDIDKKSITQVEKCIAKVEQKLDAEVEEKSTTEVVEKPVVVVEEKPIAEVKDEPMAEVEKKLISEDDEEAAATLEKTHAEVDEMPVVKVDKKSVSEVEDKPVAEVQENPVTKEENKTDEEETIIEEMEKPGPKSKVKDEESEKMECSDETEKHDKTVDTEAENISEDELPVVQAVKVPEAEEVSDEELPGPKRAELPADTEVVSEDELPTVKTEPKKEGTKRKLDATDYDPGSPTSENEAPPKKPSLEVAAEKEKDEKPKPKKLPELDKYWKAVNDDPTDFTGWTYLLQYVDQENDMEAAREAYDAFLSHYPYCYGYWRKYADYEKRKGNKKKCEEVFERGLKAIPLSVDLWIHYLTYVKTTRSEDEEFIRSQFERALTACGLEFRSDRLWESFIKWETEGKRLRKVTAIYDRLLATPTQSYTSHFDSFQEHIANNPPNKVIEVDEFLALRKEVRHMLKHDVTTTDTATDNSDAPPGDDDQTKVVSSDEETKSIRERIVSIRRKSHKATVNAVTARWNYEEGIKRPYFHVKPLERCQLKNWQDYLDYETEQGDRIRIIVLFERCLIACALYEEFWLKFVHYLESLKDPELHSKIRDVYERACTIHHLKKPSLHLQWAMFEESVENSSRAAEILVNLEKSVPNILQIAYRRINLERRRSDHEKCIQLYEHYIANSKNKMISSNIAIKYSRFCFRIMKDFDKAQEVLKGAITKDPNNPRLYLQLIDLTLQKENVTDADVIEIIDSFLEKETTDVDQKVLFSQRKLEYVEDFGADVQSIQMAHEQYQKWLKQSKDNLKKKEVKTEAASSSSKKEKSATPSSSTATAYSSYGTYGSSSAQPSYPYSGSQQGQNYYPQYGQGDQQYQYQNWQYPQGGYGGYNQWGGYSGGYGY